MKYRIGHETMARVTKCLFNFECLNDGNCPMCSVEKEIASFGFFVKDRHRREACPYLLPYGHSYICYCPVRMEIFKKYNQ
ncbi:MAG: hypothetical protein AB1442_01395 [Nitrospirota bacterium]